VPFPLTPFSLRTAVTSPEQPPYHRPAPWPEPGTALEPARAADIVLEWLAENREYLLRVIERLMYPDERGRCEWEPADVIARLAVRAHRGNGLAGSLVAHADGSRPIDDPQKILLKHTAWMVQEYRKEHPAGRRELATSNVQILEATTEDLDGDLGYATLVEVLMQGAEAAFDLCSNGHGDGKVTWAQYLETQLPALHRLFDSAAPPEVAQALRQLTDDDRICVLLGLFPLRMPPLAVATYREARGAATSTTEEATRQRIARLRHRLAAVWPPGPAADRALGDPRRDSRRREGRDGAS
jgi:hypothetical protein